MQSLPAGRGGNLLRRGRAREWNQRESKQVEEDSRKHSPNASKMLGELR